MIAENESHRVLLLGQDQSLYQQLLDVTTRSSSAINLVHADSLLALGSFAGLKEFDLIVVDYDLKSIRGIEVAQYVQAFFAEIPVIVLRTADEQIFFLWIKSSNLRFNVVLKCHESCVVNMA